MADIPQTKFNSPWTVANIEAELNGVKAARGTGTLSEALAAKEDAAAYAIDKAALDAEIAAVADAGAKNVLHTLRASGSSATGLTYTLNADGTYTLGGTTSSNANISGVCTLADIPAEWVGKTVVLTGGISTAIRLSVYNGNTQTEYTDSGSGTEFEITQEMITNPYTIRLLVNSGTDCTGQVLKPMLRLSAIKSDTFQPYAPTNYELYQMILALQGTRGLNSMRSEPDPEESEER